MQSKNFIPKRKYVHFNSNNYYLYKFPSHICKYCDVFIKEHLMHLTLILKFHLFLKLQDFSIITVKLFLINIVNVIKTHMIVKAFVKSYFKFPFYQFHANILICQYLKF